MTISMGAVASHSTGSFSVRLLHCAGELAALSKLNSIKIKISSFEWNNIVLEIEK